MTRSTKGGGGSGGGGGGGGQTQKQQQQKTLGEFDFLARSFFPEVAEQLDDSGAAAAVFSAGNPDKFHANYVAGADFLADLERELGSLEAVEAFRETRSYRTFVGRWNLPIYFQIRWSFAHQLV